MAMRIVVTVIVISGAAIIVSYFALGRPDALFAGGTFPQLVSGARNLSAAPASDSALASILRIAVIGAVVALVVLIGAAGVWDAWQSRQCRGHPQPGESPRPAGDMPANAAWRGSSPATVRGLHATDAGSPWSSESTRLHNPRIERASTGPDTLQGGTA